MAIRFRCQCGQKLRVGDDRGGLQAKCPKCRAVLTVPHPSESPPPEPPESPAPEPVESPLPVPAAEQPPPPTASSASAPAVEEVASDLRTGLRIPRPESADEVLPEIVIRDDSADWVVGSSTPPHSEETSIDYDRVAVPRRVLYLQGGLLAVVALLSFILGILVSSRTTPRQSADHGAQPCVLSGLVTISSDDAARPDGGSVVIALPADRRPAPDARVAVAGLRPHDPIPIDSHASLRAIRGLGGDCVRTNDDGEFQIRLPQDGQYFVLVISRRAARSATDNLEVADVAQMGRYFDNVVDLVDDRKYQWRTVTLRGTTTLDTAF